MPPVANSEPSEVQQYAAAAARLTRLLIWKPPSNYGRSSKKHANCYLFPYFLCGIATGNPYKIQQTTWNLAHQTEGGEYVKRDTLMKNDFKQTQLSPIPISNNRPPVSARGGGKHGGTGEETNLRVRGENQSVCSSHFGVWASPTSASPTRGATITHPHVSNKTSWISTPSGCFTRQHP